jgi:hypothetical protein
VKVPITNLALESFIRKKARVQVFTIELDLVGRFLQNREYLLVYGGNAGRPKAKLIENENPSDFFNLSWSGTLEEQESYWQQKQELPCARTFGTS